MMYQEQQYLGSFLRRVVTRIMLEHGSDTPMEHESYLPQGKSIDDYLLQYTGLLDKNGKKIYEADIVKFRSGNEYEVGEVVFGKHNGAFCFFLPKEGIRVPMLNFMATMSLAATYDFEVIGNRYEHPELLTA